MKEELEKIENKLKASEERYRRLFETAQDGILILDAQTGKINDVNPFLENLLGYTKKEILGKKLWEIGAFKDIKKSKEIFKILQKTGLASYENLPLQTKEGKLIEVGFVSNSYIVGEEHVIQCNVRDISERKKEESVDKAMIFIQHEKMKNIFFADVTHELRTPLAIIKGSVELALRDKNEKNSPTKTFKAIDVEVNHLAEMLSDLTMLTSVTTDFYKKVDTYKVNLKYLVSSVAERLKKITITKNIKVHTKNLPSGNIEGDRVYLEKLFSNLIGNAIFYGKKNGSVTITGKKTKKHITINIIDDGMGIPEEDMPNIFERFYRSDDARKTRREGTGLGLAISKWIAEAHKGNISVTSVINKGTTLTITFPLA